MEITVCNDFRSDIYYIVEVDLLFDDGVEYTAPVVNVRKRVSKWPPGVHTSD